MPKGFTDNEREIIRNKLISAGRDLFAKHGIRKTNVEELTQAAGISKGAFYIFYKSKEELFMDIVEQFEREFRSQVFSDLNLRNRSPRLAFAELLMNAFSVWKENPLLKNFRVEDYEHLMRKLPPQTMEAHFQNDEIFIGELIENLQAQGMTIQAKPDEISGLMKALFYVSLHEDEIGKDEYPRTIETLIHLVSDYLIDE
jgi:AcrR family transcriptional regulator